MKPQGIFICDRLAAQHCAELLRSSRQAVNPLVELEPFGERLAAQLGDRIGRMFPGVRVAAAAGAAAELPASVNERRGEPVFTSLVAIGPKDASLYVSLPQGAVLAMVDVALGGTGKDCEMPGGKLPLSVQLMFTRFEKAVTEALAAAFELTGADDVRVRNPGAPPEPAVPFAGCKRTVLPLKLTIAEAKPAELLLTFPGASLASLFTASTQRSPSAPRATPAAPTAEPFAGIPLSLKAILVDMAVPVSTLSRLKPGTIIPVAVARSVPLIAGEQVVAHGTVGSLDNRTALQLTRMTSAKEI